MMQTILMLLPPLALLASIALLTRALRHGAHTGRPRSIIARAALLTLLAAAGAWLYTARTASGAGNAPTPIFSLAARIGLSTEITADDLEELCLRLENDELPEDQIDALVERGLAVQADESIDWEPLWGRFIEIANGRGETSRQQWQRYIRNAVAFDIELRDPIRSGERFYARMRPLKGRIDRGGTRDEPLARIQAIARTLIIDEAEYDLGWLCAQVWYP